MQKKLGVTDFVSEIKRVENYTDFEKLTHATHHGLQGLKLKISRVSQSRHTILLNFVEGVCCVNNSKCYQRFQKNLALQEAFETVAQIKKRLKKRDSTGAFCKKLLVGKLSSLNHGKAIRHWPFAPGITVHYNTSFSKRSVSKKVFRPHQNEKSTFFNSSVLKTFFEKLRFRVGLVWTIGLTVEIKLCFQISPRSVNRKRFPYHLEVKIAIFF